MTERLVVKASELLVGQKVLLDMGYGHPQDTWCIIKAVVISRGLFGQPQVSLKVALHNATNEPIISCDLDPDWKMDILPPPLPQCRICGKSGIPLVKYPQGYCCDGPDCVAF